MKSGASEQSKDNVALFKPVPVVLWETEQLSLAGISAEHVAIKVTRDFFQDLPNNKSSLLFQARTKYLIYCSNATLHSIPNVDQAIILEIFLLNFSSSNYIRSDNHPILLSDSDSSPAFKSFVIALNDYLAAQQMPNVTIWNLSDKDFSDQINEGHRPLTVEDSDNSIPILADVWLADPLYLGDYIFFFSKSVNDASNNGELFLANCTEYLKRIPVLFNLVQHYLNTAERLETLTTAQQTLKDRLVSSNSFIEIAKTKYKDDYEELFKFYHNEYEILPLWYKRFGHILKVITNKRTFKSLFSNQVKKYKT